MFACTQRHSFHLVSESPWPFFCATGALGLTFGFALFFHGFIGGWSLIEFSLFYLICSASCWWRDVIREASLDGAHTTKVQHGLALGMFLFIASEVMFFFAFFWSYFYFSFNPSISLGGIWPPMFLIVLDPFEVPLLNTILLLSSGASLTWSHHSLVLGNKSQSALGLLFTIKLGLIFTAWQVFEYLEAPFSISDSVFGSIFFLSTGFHGFHVFVGTCFLVVCFFRVLFDDFTLDHHFGFEASAWYWHFVDVVWLVLYTVFYVWGSFSGL